MASFKIISYCLLFLCISQLQAQKHPVFYGGIEFYRNSTFSNSRYSSLNIGSQIYQVKFFAPEIGFTHYWGAIDEIENYINPQPSHIPHGKFLQGFNASFLSLNPKLKFGKEDAFLTINPVYHTGTMTGKAGYLEYSGINGRYESVAKSQRISEKYSFWSFAVGFEGLALTNRYWFALSLHYTTINARGVWKQLDFSEYDINPDTGYINTIGFGIRFYYNPFGSKND